MNEPDNHLLVLLQNLLDVVYPKIQLFLVLNSPQMKREANNIIVTTQQN